MRIWTLKQRDKWKGHHVVWGLPRPMGVDDVELEAGPGGDQTALILNWYRPLLIDAINPSLTRLSTAVFAHSDGADVGQDSPTYFHG